VCTLDLNDAVGALDVLAQLAADLDPAWDLSFLGDGR
jgi:hypothetical protein